MLSDFKRSRNPAGRVSWIIQVENISAFHEISDCTTFPPNQKEAEIVSSAWNFREHRKNPSLENKTREEKTTWDDYHQEAPVVMIIQAWKILSSVFTATGWRLALGGKWNRLYSILVSVYKSQLSMVVSEQQTRARSSEQSCKVYGAWMWLWSGHEHSRSFFHRKIGFVPKWRHLCTRRKKNSNARNGRCYKFDCSYEELFS